jgi:hypothetical protein
VNLGDVAAKQPCSAARTSKARYTEDGRMPIDNNPLERDIRIFENALRVYAFTALANKRSEAGSMLLISA